LKIVTDENCVIKLKIEIFVSLTLKSTDILDFIQ